MPRAPLSPMPMTSAMRERVNFVIRHRLAKAPDGPEFTEYIDQGPHGGHFDIGGYKVWAGYFASYTPWGVACIEHAFRLRMRDPEPGDTKTHIKREIQTNPHLHPKIKARLLHDLRRARVRYDWWRLLDQRYCACILALDEGQPDPALEAEILADSNLPEFVRENLLLNLRLRAGGTGELLTREGPRAPV